MAAPALVSPPLPLMVPDTPKAKQVVGQGAVVGHGGLAMEPSCPLVPSPNCSVPAVMLVPPV